MVGVVQLVERQIVVLVVEGSSPFVHPIFLQGYSQVGKAPDFDSGMRRFESCYPCHFVITRWKSLYKSKFMTH